MTLTKTIAATGIVAALFLPSLVATPSFAASTVQSFTKVVVSSVGGGLSATACGTYGADGKVQSVCYKVGSTAAGKIYDGMFWVKDKNNEGMAIIGRELRKRALAAIEAAKRK